MNEKGGLYGPTSFSELDELISAREEAERVMSLGATFSMLSDNIIMSDDVEDKASALNSLVSEYTQRINTEKTKELEKKGIVSALRDMIKQDEQAPMKPEGRSMSFVKGKNGRWLWFARYSNKYLDDDYPREIISEESHLNFVKSVKEGVEDYPELWLHHIRGTAWGKATWVGYDQGFALAAGYVYPEYDDIAESLSKQSNIILSHGMIPESIVRDSDSPNIILRHVTKEISPLPAHRAANKLTGFILLEEDSMENKGLSLEDKEILSDMGISLASIEKLDASTSKLASVAENSSLPRKEASGPELEAEVVEETEVSIETSVETEEVETEAAEEVETQEREETQGENIISDELIGALVKSIEVLSTKITNIEDMTQVNANRIEQMSSEHNKIVGESTKATRMSILKSVIGQEEARIDGRKSLARSGPTETEPNGGGLFWRKEGWTNAQ